MFNQYQQYNPYQQYQVPPIPQKTEIVQVSGEAGARAYAMAANSSIILLDNSAPLIWLKMTDGAGFPTLTPYAITPFKQDKKTDFSSDLEERVKRLEDILNESNSQSVKSVRKDSPNDSES